MSNVAETIVLDLLQIDARFLHREPNINDIEYIGKLIVILNATAKYVFFPFSSISEF
jgi:hypothetical protein